MQAASPADVWMIAQSLQKATEERSESVRVYDPDFADFLNTEQIYSMGSALGITIYSQDDILYNLLDRHRFHP